MKKQLFYPLLVLVFMCSTAFVHAPAQLFKTGLKITVLDNLGNPQAGAVVTLYPTEQDYRKNTNAVMPADTTNAKGAVIFRPLEPTVYFVDARTDKKSNTGLAVQTDSLRENRLNKVNIVIE